MCSKESVWEYRPATGMANGFFVVVVVGSHPEALGHGYSYFIFPFNSFAMDSELRLQLSPLYLGKPSCSVSSSLPSSVGSFREPPLKLLKASQALFLLLRAGQSNRKSGLLLV